MWAHRTRKRIEVEVKEVERERGAERLVLEVLIVEMHLKY